MKTIKQHPFVFMLICFVMLAVSLNVFAALTNTYDTATPAGSDDPRFADDRMRETKAAVQEFMNDHNGQTDEGDHYWPLTGTEVSDTAVGQHRMVTLRQLADNPSTLTSYGTTTDLGFLYQKNDTDNGELYWQDEADNVLQLTTDGTWKAGTMTGNVAVTGTLDVTGLTELIGVATIADASVTKTTAAPSTDAMIANKKYVDDQNTAQISGLAKAWSKSTGSTVNAGFNVASVDDTGGTGNYVVTWTVPFATANYVVNVTADESSAAISTTIETQLAGSVEITTRLTTSGVTRNIDSLHVIAFGDQ